MAEISFAVLPGDGVGPEVTQAALDVLSVVTKRKGYRVFWEQWPIGWTAMVDGDDPLPEETLKACLAVDAVLLGAVGDPRADGLPPSERPVAGLLRLRRDLGCFANLRPVRISDGLVRYSAVRPDRVRQTDLMIVRELAGGLYYGEPRGFDEEAGRGWNTLSYEREEIRRIATVAFDLARARRGKVTSIDKANVLEVSRVWRIVVEEVASKYADVELEHMLVDRAAMEIILRPRNFDTVLTDNLFGDILSDGAAALFGSLGLQASASIGGCTDLYEPAHGSAPDIAGSGIANPAAAILSVAMMLEYTFGLVAEARAIERALDRVYVDGCRTSDLESSEDATAPMGTGAFTELVIDQLETELEATS
jgi:3-isopropylmalate dehydrogenase